MERTDVLTAKEKMLLDALEPRAVQEGVEIVDIEIVGAKKAPTIRVFVDTPDGVSFDVLSSAQAWIGDLLDEVDPFPGAYTMEVSSPGIDRPLRTLQHFQRFAGSTVRIRTCEPVDGRANFKGVLSVEGDVLQIEDGGETFRIPFSTVKKANLIGEIEF
ncbi:ribosome maturation factor RimP [Adlercreutzia murintestinalis]|uniref:ribosome maturation factor RimP n=1 Tax=Adlercreutzia murintestinalis TaxID=2941325 RepID=UPI0032E3E414